MTINWLFNCDDPTVILSKANAIIKKNIANRKKALFSANINELVNVLSCDEHIFNTFFQLACLMQYVSSDKNMRKTWHSVDTMFKNHIIKTNTDHKLYKKINSMMKHNKNQISDADLLYLTSISETLIKNGAKYANDKPIFESMLIINDSIKKCTNTFSSTDLLKLATLRNDFALFNNFRCYFDFVSNIDIDEFKTLLKSINTLPILQTKDIDFELIHAKKYPLYKAMNTIFDILHDFFNINFVPITSSDLWHPSVKTFNIVYNNNACCILYIDLAQRSGTHAKPIEPVSLVLQESHNDNLPICVLFGTPSDTISYRDIIHLFMQFADIIHVSFNRTKYGLNINIENDMKTFMDNLFEHIISNYSIMKNYFPDKNIFIQLNNLNTFNLKNLCASILFDYYIHSSQLAKLKNKTLFINKYQSIYNTVFNTNTIFDSIPNNVVSLCAYNGGTAYTIIMNNVIAFNILKIFINKPSSICEFIDDVLVSNTYPFRQCIEKFAEHINKYEHSSDEYSLSPLNNSSDKPSDKPLISISSEISSSDETNSYSSASYNKESLTDTSSKSQTNYFTEN